MQTGADAARIDRTENWDKPEDESDDDVILVGFERYGDKSKNGKSQTMQEMLCRNRKEINKTKKNCNFLKKDSQI
jgi:hypothetical protein